ncbi:hypothetical protein Scep_012412 [Stephania cephalantha]|uniref:Uncharacterized protein n=1 Tax=Stephania cephalantha TaxID=152367 RepID=A0AAP0JF29_9MAGN
MLVDIVVIVLILPMLALTVANWSSNFPQQEGRSLEEMLKDLITVNEHLDNLVSEEEFPEPIYCDQEEDGSAITLRSVEEHEYLTELEDELEVLPSKPTL